MLKEGPEQQSDIAGLLEKAASTVERADYSQAEQLYSHILNLLEQSHAGESPEAALCLQNLAEIHHLSGQLDSAIPYYQRLLTIGEKILGESHQDVLATGFRLATAYEALKQPEEADEIYKWVINCAERSLGIAHPFTQKIRDAYFSFMNNKAPSNELDFRFALTPPPSPKSDPQYETLEFEGDEREDLSVRARAAKKASSYKRPTKIKHLRYGADSADEKVSTAVGIRNVWHHGRSVFVAIPGLIIFMVITFMALSKAQVDYGALEGSKLSARLTQLGSFQSLDGVTGIKFNRDGHAILDNDVHHTQIPYVILKGGLDDFKAMLVGGFIRREQWYSFGKDQLVSENGNVLYPPGAHEHFVAGKLRALKQFAQRYYLKTGCYPNDAKKWANEPELNYMSPFTGRIDSPTSKTLNGTLDRDYLFPNIQTDGAGQSAYDFLRTAAHHTWRDEPMGSPGKINTLSLFIAQRCADGFKVVEFYARGYDRDGMALTAGKPGTYLVVALKAGKDLSQEAEDHTQDTEECSIRPPDRICVAVSDSADLGFLHRGLQNILMAIAFVFGVCWIFIESRKRIADPQKRPQPCEIGFAVSVFLLAVVAIIHLLP